MAGINRAFAPLSSRWLTQSYRTGSRLTRRCRDALLAHLLLNIAQAFCFTRRTIGFIEQRRSPLHRPLTKLVGDRSGVTAIEYALIAALIAVAAIAAFTLVGTRLSTTFSTVAGKL